MMSQKNINNVKNTIEDQDEDFLFTLSDIIDDSKINHHAIVRHLMYVWECVLGKKIDKVVNLNYPDIIELQRDLQPLVHKQNIFLMI